jgi:polyisoprenoid-binding protein YceI
MESKVRFALDSKASQLTVHGFASGLASVVAHNPKFAIQEFSGEARFTPGTLAEASLRIVMKASSLNLVDEVTEYDRQEIHRVTFDEVLEAKSYPEIVFESSQIAVAKISDNLFRATVTGNLALHGVRRTHTFKAQVVVGEDSLRAYGDFNVNQSEYGIRTASIAGGTLKMKDEVKIAFFIIGRKEG